MYSALIILCPAKRPWCFTGSSKNGVLYTVLFQSISLNITFPGHGATMAIFQDEKRSAPHCEIAAYSGGWGVSDAGI